MSRWPTQRARGYQVRRVLILDGIGEIYVESGGVELLSALTGDPVTSVDDRPIQPCLDVRGSTDCAADRKAGVATGRPWAATLVWDWMTSTLFQTPAHTATTSALTGASGSTISVTSTTGWPTDGEAWIGRECFSYTGVTATSFTGVTRGIYGPADVHPAGARVTSRPTAWKGTRATLWRVLCCPAGRPLVAAWGVAGDYQAIDWTGWLTEAPVPTQHGIEIRMAPTVRLLAQDVGAESRGTTVPPMAPGLDGGRILATSADSITVHREGGVSSRLYGGIGLQTIAQWGADVAAAWLDAWTTAIEQALVAPIEGRLAVSCVTGSPTYDWLAVEPSAWFLSGGRQSLPQVEWSGSAVQIAWRRRLDFADPDTGWMEVAIEVDDTGYAALDDTGALAITCGGVTEIVTYDTLTPTPQPDRYVVRILGRDRGRTGRAPIWTEPGTWARVALVDTTVGTAALTLLQSSGAANRGDYDTLATARGLGIDDSLIDVSRWLSYPLGSTLVQAAPEGPESIETTLGGWLALHQLCAVQIGGVVSVVSWVPIEGPDLTAADVLMGSHTPAETIQGPGSVQVTVGDTAIATVVDATAVQAAGAEVWQISAPGAERTQAAWLASDLLRLSEGVAVVRLAVPGWAEWDIGDALTLATAHPTVYSWSAGRAPAGVAARVIGREDMMADDTATLTVLLAGQAGGSQWLCPSLRVTSAAASVLTVTGDTSLFAVGEKVLLYRPGTGDVVTVPVTAISGQDVTLASWLSGYLDCNGTVWAGAAGAMTGIAGVWSRVVVGSEGDDGYQIATGRDIQIYRDGDIWKALWTMDAVAEFAATPDDPGVTGLRAIAATRGPGATRTLSWAGATTDGTGSDSNGGAAPLNADITIAIANPAGSASPSPARIYADLVIQGTPTVSQLRALLTTPPWQVFTPSTILRCYIPALAYTSGSDHIIPDVAALVGGTLPAVDAVIQAGTLTDITRTDAALAGDVLTYPPTDDCTAAQAAFMHVDADDRWT